MTRWLEAARKAGWNGAKGGEENPAPSALGFCQVSSGVPEGEAARAELRSDEIAPPAETRFRRVLSGVPDPEKPAPGVLSGSVRVSERVEPVQAAPSESDPETLLAWLRLHCPSTYGAAAVALRWGATRAWQAEARLRASGRVWIDGTGRTRVADGDPEKGVRDDA